MDSLPSKADFLKTLEGLSYEERLAKASKFGYQHKDSPALDSWIVEMRQHPAPEVPETPREEGFSELLPAQKLNIAKHYLEDQVAVTASVAAKKTPLLVAELSSPSNWFRPLAAKAVVKQLSKIDDATLEKQVLSAPPATRKKLLMNLFRTKNTALLEKLYPQLAQQKGTDVAISMLHGCSSAFIKATVAADQEIFHNKRFQWKKICRFHGPLLIEWIRDDFVKGCAVFGRGTLWDTWEGRIKEFVGQFFFKAKMTAAYWDLYEEYPIISPIGNWSGHSESNSDCWHYSLTPLMQAQFVHFMTVCSAKMLAFWEKHTELDAAGAIRCPLPFGLFQQKERVLTKYLAGFEKIVRKVTTLKETCAKKHCTLTNYYGQYVNCLNGKKTALLVQMYPLYLEFQKLIPFPKAGTWVSYSRDILDTVLCSSENRLAKWLDKLAVNVRIGRNDEREKLAARHAKELKNLVEILKLEFKANHPVFFDSPQFSDGTISGTQPPAWNSLMNMIESSSAHFLVEIRQLLEPFFSKRKDVIENKGAPWISAWSVSFVAAVPHFFRYIHSLLGEQPQHGGGRGTWTTVSDAEKDALTKLRVELFDIAYSFFSLNKISNFGAFCGVLPYLAVDQRIKAFELYSATYEALAEEGELQRMLYFLPNEAYAKVVVTLLASDSITDKCKLDLYSYRNLADHSIRKEMQLAADSNSDVARKEAILNLIGSTSNSAESEKVVQLKRTLTFLRTKLKNEKIEMRIHGLTVLIEKGSQSLFPKGFTQEILDLYFNLLQDAIEAKDLELWNKIEDFEWTSNGERHDHPCLGKFIELSKFAIKEGALDPSNGLIEFGAELSWRISTFRESLNECSKSWVLALPNELREADFFRSADEVNTFATAYMKAVQARVEKKNPKWRDNLGHWAILLKGTIAQNWAKCDVVTGWLKSLVTSITSAKKDIYGSYIVKADHPALKVFEHLLKLERGRAILNPIIVDYIEALLRSTQAKVVVYQYITLKERKKKGKARLQQRTESIENLLAITPSAIHLKVVWRHMMRWQSHKLDRFIGAREPFRGVFYEEPVNRLYGKPVAGSAAAPTATPVRKVPRAAPPPPDQWPDVKHVVTELTKRSKELKIQKKMLKDLQSNPVHPDFFILPGCYGLKRFLPSQITRLADEWLALALNRDGAVHQRTQAARRWTLMPTVTYADIVKILAENSKPVKDEEGVTIRKPLEVNLVEAFLQGCTCNDEPLAPLNYLLTPEFLSSDLARVAAFAVAGAVSQLQPGGLTELIKLVLTGKRREGLKVTAYKAMINLLAQNPTAKHIGMIEHEWNRQELHRDVRIQIVKSAFVFLKKGTEQSLRVAWAIILSCVTKKKEDWKYISEVLTVICGAQPEVAQQSRPNPRAAKRVEVPQPLVPSAIFLLPTLEGHLSTLARIRVPTNQVTKFATEVLIPIAQTAEDDDVRMLARIILYNFRTQKGVVHLAANLYRDFLCNTEDALFTSKKEKEMTETYKARFQEISTRFLSLTGCQPNTLGETREFASKRLVTETIGALCNRLKNLNKAENRKQRVCLLALVDEFFNRFDTRALRGCWDQAQEDEFFAPLKKFGELFYKFLFSRQLTIFVETRDYAEAAFVIAHDMIKFVSTKSHDLADWAVQRFVIFLQSTPHDFYSYRNELLKKLMSLSYEKGTTPAFRSVLCRLVLAGVPTVYAADHFEPIHKQVLKFFDFSIRECVREGIHDHVNNIAREFFRIATILAPRDYGDDQTRDLKEVEKKMLTHVLTYLKPIAANEDIITLRVAVEYAKILLNEKPSLFARIGEFVGPTLHWLINEQTGTTSSSEFSEKIVELLQSMEEKLTKIDWRTTDKTKVSKSVCAVITAILDNISCYSFWN